MSRGFLIAAPQSGSGKTTITLGLLRALARAGHAPRSAKAGPDFIDPAFHAAASGRSCVNLDPWAMRPDYLQHLAGQDDGLLVVEGMMGLFDGGADGRGSAADLADMLGLPVVLVVDAAKQSHSIAALVAGFRDHRSDLQMAGVILNKVGSARHETLLREALAQIDMPVLGCVFRHADLQHPSRHLGLVQAQERPDLEAFLDGAADLVADQVDLDALLALRRNDMAAGDSQSIRPFGQRIAVARDDAFAFCYPHLLDGFRAQGAEICFFSPLNDEAPMATCDAVYLPGGYPELHGGRLTANANFKTGMANAAAAGAFIFGECGGYMVLGESLIDADGANHPMLNFLPLITSFERKKLHLGYRKAKILSTLPFNDKDLELTAHEFHYSVVVKESGSARLFRVTDARNTDLGDMGMIAGNVAGSYLHLIDRR